MHQHLDAQRERAPIEGARTSRKGFNELYDHYFPRVYAYVASRVSSTQDAEDLVSEVFLKAFGSLDRFADRGPGSFAAWRFRIAHNLVGDFWRKQHPESSLEAIAKHPGGEELTESVVLRDERGRYLRQLVRSLSPRQQEVITLRFFGGLRNREIAAVLRLDERTVASHLCRGLDELHRRYSLELASTESEDDVNA